MLIAKCGNGCTLTIIYGDTGLLMQGLAALLILSSEIAVD